jgi:hypothetical protein
LIERWTDTIERSLPEFARQSSVRADSPTDDTRTKPTLCRWMRYAVPQDPRTVIESG